MNDSEPAENTDRELWREEHPSLNPDSIFVTNGNGIGINCGGHVVVLPLREWHRLATPPADDKVAALAAEGTLRDACDMTSSREIVARAIAPGVMRKNALKPGTAAHAKLDAQQDHLLKQADAVLSVLSALSAFHLGNGVWPDFIAPQQYENPDSSWTDPHLPDFRLIWRLAKEKGYAVGLHGSMRRDCDLIAVPWIDNAAGPETLIEHLCVGLGARQIGSGEAKPLGRLAVTLQIKDAYAKPIDLSIVRLSRDVQADLLHERTLVTSEIASRIRAKAEATALRAFLASKGGET